MKKMKTIEEFAVDLSTKEVKKGNSYSQGLKVGIEFGVEKGVEFAQKWISIEDELPELNSGTVFLKGIDTFGETEYSVGYMEKSFGIVDNGKDLIKITHWRPIYFL